MPNKNQNVVAWSGGKPSLLIFDVNETLIDFESLNPLFERVFGDKRAGERRPLVKRPHRPSTAQHSFSRGGCAWPK